MIKKFTHIYHLHEKICGHARNTIDSIVENALKEGFREIYFTEHCPLENNNVIYRPTLQQIQELYEKITHYNELYKDKLHIHFGYEAEFSKKYEHVFTKLAKQPICEYLIFGNHYIYDMWSNECKLTASYCKTPEHLQEYLQNTIDALESNLFSLYAHPDIWLTSYRKWDEHAQNLTKQIIFYAQKYDMPLGFNANGYAHKLENYDEFFYPSKYFWKEVVKTNIKVLIECDSHSPWTFNNKTLMQAYNYAIELGLEKNIVDKIPMKKINSNQ